MRIGEVALSLKSIRGDIMLRVWHGVGRIFLVFCTAPLLLGCCSTCPSLSGRHADELFVGETVIPPQGTMSSTAKHLNGVLKQKMEARGMSSGCGEFFWSSWYNDGPEDLLYPQTVSIEEEVTCSVKPTRAGTSKAAHRIIQGRPNIRTASINQNNEI